LAIRLARALEEKAINIQRGWRLSALPAVTATAKPAVSPIANLISGARSTGTFSPTIKEQNVELTTDRFRKLLEEKGVQYFPMGDIQPPASAEKTGWVEFGEFDRLGHSMQSRLAIYIDEQIEAVAERILSLFDYGWRKVRLVTDHGWLLVPKGLPSLCLPKYLTESRWARCAWIKETAHSEMPMARWHWNSQEYFAYPPGIHCFKSGLEYAHGGISLQECIIPDFTLVSMTQPQVSARILDVQWLGMRCRVYAEKSASGICAVLRNKPGDPASNICELKSIDSEGKTGLLVEDDSLEGASATVVLLDQQGNIISKYPTVVGG
jgi:hypothetical protein